MSRSRIAHLFAAVLVVSVVPGARAAIPEAIDPAYVRHIRLIGPDGLPAVGALVAARVARHGDETGTYTPYVFNADAAGVVTITIPRDDPYIASQPDEHMFDIEAVILNGGPGIRVGLRVIPYILNTGEPLWPTDPTGVENKVIRLDSATPSLASTANDYGPDYYHCYYDGYPYATPPPVWGCGTTIWPQGLQNVPVPIAPNFGAGADMRLSMTYQNSKSTISSKNIGIDGAFYEVQHASSFGTDSSVRGYAVRNGVYGGTSDETLRISAEYKVDREITCTPSNGGECDDYTTVGPDHMIGTLTAAAGASFHDTMRSGGATNEDCGYYIEQDGIWDNTQGTNRDEAWTQGFDLDGQVEFVNFHATTTFTRYNQNTDSTSYTWSNESMTYPHHYLFVPGGNRGYDSRQPHGGATCPMIDPGGTYTDASNDGCKTLDAPCSTLGVDVDGVGDPEQPPKRVVRRCEEAPERCGKE